MRFFTPDGGFTYIIETPDCTMLLTKQQAMTLKDKINYLFDDNDWEDAYAINSAEDDGM